MACRSENPRHCCHVGCGRPAEWVLDPCIGNPLDRYTEACTFHVGELLTDAPEHRLYPIGEPSPGPRTAADFLDVDRQRLAAARLRVAERLEELRAGLAATDRDAYPGAHFRARDLIAELEPLARILGDAE